MRYTDDIAALMVTTGAIAIALSLAWLALRYAETL